MREIKFRAWDKELNDYLDVTTDVEMRKGAKGHYLVHGYRRRKVNQHPNADARGYVPEHRLVMEQHLGRFLEPTEFVHHRDQDRLNNDISNLELQGSQAEHAKKYPVGSRNDHGQFVANEPIFSELKFRLYNKNTKTTRIYALATLIGTTFRRGKFEFRGRFTGLKDKNGREIYEGDLLEYIDHDGLFEPGIYKVGFADGAFTLEQTVGDEMLDISFALSERQNPGYAPKDYQVIGNIYENPDYLTNQEAK